MKVIILIENKNLGKKGDVKEVSDGYARNFLFPHKIAEPASSQNLERLEALINSEKKTSEMNRKNALADSQALRGKEFVIKAKDKDGKLFGSVSAKKIAGLINQLGHDFTEKQIKIPTPIKEIGKHEILIELANKIDCQVILDVQEE